MCLRPNVHEQCDWLMDNILVHPTPQSHHALSAAIGFSVADNVLAESYRSIAQKVPPVKKKQCGMHIQSRKVLHPAQTLTIH